VLASQEEFCSMELVMRINGNFNHGVWLGRTFLHQLKPHRNVNHISGAQLFRHLKKTVKSQTVASLRTHSLFCQTQNGI
jgi:hypothetical protein